MNTDKTVSIIMGTYNGAEYIREQLDSILSQTYPLKEIIIQDDGSTDDTVAICTAYAESFLSYISRAMPAIWDSIRTSSRLR